MKSIKTLKDQTVRRNTPRHLGRRTPEEQAELDDRQRIHQHRDLRKLLLAVPQLSDFQIDLAIKAVNHWLRDIEHEARMKGQTTEQDVISRLRGLTE